MSISTSSINCVDDFTPAENEEVNGDAINLDNNGQLFDGKNSEQSITDQQQLKDVREKFAKMEMELKMAKLELEMAKLELENKEQKLKLHEMMVEQKALKENVAKIEQKMENNVTSDQFSKMQNDQKILLEKISELEKEQKQRKELLNFQQNYWDANFCHEKLEIIGDKKLIVHYKGNINGWCSVFAKHPILLDNNSSEIFYYEISIAKMKNYMGFGFAVKQKNNLDGVIWSRKGTYAYFSNGFICINGAGKGTNGKYFYGVGDTVGIGVNLATGQISFTKNELCLDSADLLVVTDSFHPFVSLCNSDDQIEANFGPNFKFDFATL